MKTLILMTMLVVGFQAKAASVSTCYGTIDFIGTANQGIDGAAVEKYISQWKQVSLYQQGGTIVGGIRYYIKMERLDGEVGNNLSDDLEFHLNDMSKANVGLSIKREVSISGCKTQYLD